MEMFSTEWLWDLRKTSARGHLKRSGECGRAEGLAAVLNAGQPIPQDWKSARNF